MEPIIEYTETPDRHLLHLADEAEASVADYADRSRCYAARIGEEIVGQYLLLHTRPFTAELVSLAVQEAWQGRGIGRRLVEHAIRTARELGFRRLELGTGDAGIGQIALYQKCGLRMCGIDTDYFTRFYPVPITENGIRLRHMVRLRLELD